MMRQLVIIIMFLSGSSLLFSGIGKAQEKNKFEIENISIKGINAFDEMSITNLMNTKISSLFHKSYFDKKTFEDDINSIEIYYHDQGYLDAHVLKYEMQFNEDSTAVNISVFLNEGEPTKILSIEFKGIEEGNEEELRNSIAIKSDTYFRRSEIIESKISILSYYYSHGYSDAEVNPIIDIDKEKKQVSLLFDIKENSRFIIDEIHIQGLKKTKPYILDREIGFKRGETVNQTKLLKTQRDIYETGLFRSVYIYATKPVSGKPGVKDIIIELEEKDSIRMNVSTGYDTEEEIRGKIEAYTINLMGTGRKLGSSARISRISRILSGSYTSPRILGTKWQMDIDTGWGYLIEPSYHLRKVYGLVSIGRKIGKHTLFRMQYRQDISEAENITLSTLPDHLKNNISSIELSLRHDRRNNLFNATKGVYWEITTELGQNFYGKNNTFVRSVGKIKYYYPLNRYTIAASALKIGSLSTRQRLLDTPLQERFYSGGGNSVRGYGYKMLGPLDSNGNPFGGKLVLTWNILELRRKLYKILHMVIFCDMGNVWKSAETFQITDVRTTSGLGLRLRTPVGVIRFDYGFKLDRKKNESSGEYYFSMGQAF